MAINYAGGTVVHVTFNSDATRQTLLTALGTQLVNAGWSVVAGSVGSSDCTLQSATTPQGYAVRFRLYDPGSGNCAQVTMKNLSGALTSNIAYMLPTNGKQFRIVANKYQFFMFSTGSINRQAPREIVMGGVPFVPSFITSLITNTSLGWMCYTGSSDTDTSSNNYSFRNAVATGLAVNPYSSSLLNGAMISYTYTVNQTGVRLASLTARNYQNNPTAWFDDSFSQLPAQLMWSSTSGINGTAKYIGLLWDAMVLNGQVAGETDLSFDGHTFLSITDASASLNDSFATLCVAIP